MKLFIFFIFLLILIISFIIRSYLIMRYRWVGKDSFYHLIIAQEIRKKNKIPDTINNFIVPEEYDYPPLLHVFLSLFNKKSHQMLQYIGVISDILTGSIIFIFCFIIFDVRIAILASAFYLFTPMTLDGSFSLGPRSIANLFMTTSLLSFAYYFETGLNIAVYIAVIFSSFVLLTHRLTSQSLVFSLLALSFAIQSMIPVYILTASIVVALVFTKGFYFTVIKGHISFLKIFAAKLIHKDRRKEMPDIFSNPVYLLFNVPIFILFIISLSLPEAHTIKLLTIIGLSLTVLSFIWVFGEGIRHMSNAIFTFAILSAIYVSKLSNIILIIIFILLLMLSIYKLLRLSKMIELGNITTADMLAGFEFIRSNKKNGDILLCLPLDITYNAAYFTGCIMLQSSGGFAKGLDFNQKLHQLVKKDLNKLIGEYNVDWIFLMNRNVKIIGGSIAFKLENITVMYIDK